MKFGQSLAKLLSESHLAGVFRICMMHLSPFTYLDSHLLPKGLEIGKDTHVVVNACSQGVDLQKIPLTVVTARAD